MVDREDKSNSTISYDYSKPKAIGASTEISQVTGNGEHNFTTEAVSKLNTYSSSVGARRTKVHFIQV